MTQLRRFGVVFPCCAVRVVVCRVSVHVSVDEEAVEGESPVGRTFHVLVIGP
jgi:hypothetical protein